MRVIAIVVARSGGETLATTLSAIAEQTRPVDVLIGVDNGSRGQARAPFDAARPAHIVSTGGVVSFGEAVELATRVVATDVRPDDVLWLLSDDSTPRRDALANLVGALEVSRSAGVVGPKQLESQESDPGVPPTIVEFGLSLSPRGRCVSLVDDELDQGQYDTMSDVLAVGANGMLVREVVWRSLGGFDPGLPDVDDALDFCVRARLAGYLVQVVPAAAVVTNGSGSLGRVRPLRERDRRRKARLQRRAELYRRLVYARGLAPLFVWLSLVPVALVRMVGQLLAKRPGLVMGELWAALAVAFSLGSVARSRARLARQRVAPWSTLDGVRLSSADVRRRMSLSREAALIQLHGEKRPLHFFAGGGAWTVVLLAIVSVVMLFPLIGATTLAGGALLPVGHSLSDMWAQVGFGWRSGAPGIAGPADPFTVVMATLGTLTWWHPSMSLVLVWFAAIPISGLGAWMLAARLTQRPVIRAFAAITYGLAPTLLVALADGRPAAVLAHLTLPWMFVTGFRAARSWSASATTALLLAVVIACAPSLAPALAVVWVGAILLTGRAVARFIAIPIPTLVLFAPLVIVQLGRLNPLGLLSDPGLITSFPVAPSWQTVLGFPTLGLGGWLDVTDQAPWGLSVAAGLVVLVLVSVVVSLAIVGLFSTHPIRAQLAMLVMLLGIVTAVGSTYVRVAFSGSEPTPMWPGAGLSLAWLALIVASMTGIAVLRRFSVYPAVAAIVAVTILAIPLLSAFFVDRAVVASGKDSVFPAYVSAEASRDARLGTLILHTAPDGGVVATLSRGQGPSLSAQSTLVNTNGSVDSSLVDFAQLAGNLVSVSGDNGEEQLRAWGIGFVLLSPPALDSNGSVTTQSQDAYARSSSALHANAALEEVGDTAVGILWRLPDVETVVVDQGESRTAVEPWRSVVLGSQVLVLLLTLLLAIPTGTLAPNPVRRELPGIDDDLDVGVSDDVLGGDDEPQN